MAFDQSTIFKAYDVRGIVPDELDADLAYKVGRALVLLPEARSRWRWGTTCASRAHRWPQR